MTTQRYDAFHGRSESYWQERNALVDAVRAADADAPSAVADPEAFTAWLHGPAGERYSLALAALRAFDAAHGGTPVL